MGPSLAMERRQLLVHVMTLLLFFAQCCCWLLGSPSNAVELNSNGSQHTVRICFGMWVNSVYFDPEFGANSSVTPQDLNGVEMDIEEFNLYFSGLEVEIISAVVLGGYLDKLVENGGLPLYTFTYFEKWLEGAYKTRTGECDVFFDALVANDDRDSCDCPEAPGGNLSKLTSSNICCLDFSTPYISDSYTAVTPVMLTTTGIWDYLTDNFTLDDLAVVCGVILAVFLSGHLVWLFERKKNSEQFQEHYLDGVDDGLWWSLVTMTTVGYGDKTPSSGSGKCIGAVWMIVGLFLGGVINGYLAAAVLALESKNQVAIMSVDTLTELVNDYRPTCVVSGAPLDYLVVNGLQEGIDFVVQQNSMECYQLMNSTESTVKSVFGTKSMFVVDADEYTYAEVYKFRTEAAPLTTTDNGCTIGGAIKGIFRAFSFPEGSPLVDVFNAAFESFIDGEIVYSPYVAATFNNGWKLDIAMAQYDLDFDPIAKIHVEKRAAGASNNEMVQFIFICVVVILCCSFGVARGVYHILKCRGKKTARHHKAAKRTPSAYPLVNPDASVADKCDDKTNNSASVGVDLIPSRNSIAADELTHLRREMEEIHNAQNDMRALLQQLVESSSTFARTSSQQCRPDVRLSAIELQPMQ